jgi:hypothetical protein
VSVTVAATSDTPAPLALGHHEQKYNPTYVPFRGKGTSFRASDTVTPSKSSSCNDIRGLVGSCYIDVTEQAWWIEANSKRRLKD